jgi:hypothetical protein
LVEKTVLIFLSPILTFIIILISSKFFDWH